MGYAKVTIKRTVLAFVGLVLPWTSGCDPQRDECRWNPTTQRVECGEPLPRNPDDVDCSPSAPFDKRCPR